MIKWNLVICLSLVMIVTMSVATSVYADAVTIHRDSYGVPHVYAETLEGVYFGFGYSVAQDRLFQLEMLKRMYQGRTAEVLGADFYAVDTFWRTEYPSTDELEEQFNELDEKYQTILTAYADGVNAWIEEVEEDIENKLPYEYHQLNFLPSEWDAIDVASTYLTSLGFFMDLSAENLNVQLYDFLQTKYGADADLYFNDMVWEFDSSAYTTVPSTTLGQVSPSVSNSQLAQLDMRGMMKSALVLDKTDKLNQTILQTQGFGLPEKMKMGASKAASYLVIVGSEKSATGNPLIMGGPQFDFWLPSVLHEIGLHGPGIDVVGTTLIGTPFIMFGQTETTAFSTTAGGDNILDIFEEKLNPENPTQYYYNGDWVDMEKHVEMIPVKGEEPREFVLYSTVHGPVVTQVDVDGDGVNDVAYTKQLSCRDSYLSGIPSWTEAQSANTPEKFIEAAKMLTLSINHFYADSDGNIGYFHSGKYPIRTHREDFDIRIPTPGTGEYEWVGFRDMDENPHVINPDTDVIINWNNKPAGDWGNGDLGSIFLWAGWSNDHRVDTIAKLIDSKEKVSVEDIEMIIHHISDLDKRAKALKPYLIEALADVNDPELIQVKKDLMNWNNLRRDSDHDGYYDHIGYTIFDAWWPMVNERIFADDLGKHWETLLYNYAGYSFFTRVVEGKEANLPLQMDYLNGEEWETIFVEVLKATLTSLKEERGADSGSWYTKAKTMGFVPMHFGMMTTSLGELPQIPYMDRGTQNHIVELAKPVTIGRNVFPPGQSGFISKDGIPSPHFADQVSHFAEWEYKDMLLLKGDVLLDAQETEIVIYKK